MTRWWRLGLVLVVCGLLWGGVACQSEVAEEGGERWARPQFILFYSDN